jgi:hypothetical protein
VTTLRADVGSGGGTWAAAAAPMTDRVPARGLSCVRPVHALCRPYGRPVFSPSTTAPRHTRVISDFLLKMPPSLLFEPPLYYRETHGLPAVEGRRHRLQHLQGSHCSTVTVPKSGRASQAVA